MNDPILRFTDGTKIVDILAPNSGWRMAKPYWNIRIAQRKGDGTKVNSAIAEGQRLVAQEYDNVIETIPLTAHGSDQNATIQTINDLLSLARQSGDYWAKTYEFDDVWMEVRPACADALTGYARVVQMRLVELTNPFGQPFFSPAKEAFMDDLSLIVEREPLWRALPPGEIIGPLYNYIKNPDFELWNNGVTDSQPDSWTDLETIQITGQNGQQSTAVHSGNYALKVRVSGSTLTGRFKGVTQLISGTRNNTTYTVVAWVRSEGVSNGVGRILITYASQLELYRSSTRHGWTLYAGTITTGIADIVAINCEILTTAANTDGTVYFDSLMFLEGDWTEEAENGTLPYMSSSHVVNHQDVPGGIVEAGDVNYVDVWEIPGTEDALLRLEIMNNTTPTGTNPAQVFATVRVGMRRIEDCFLFDNIHDPVGPVDTTAANNTRLESGDLSNAFVNLTTKIVASDTESNEGRFRILARCFDNRSSGTPNLKLRLQYALGALGVGQKALNPVTSPVLQQWFMANLTPNAAVNFDAKFATDVPALLGYTIQASRDVGTDKVYLDYCLAMPTDGGYLEASINPPITFGNALIVDNTASQSVGTTQLRSGWRLIATIPGPKTGVWEFAGGTYFLSPNIDRFYAGTWQQVFTGSPGRATGVFNGRLFISTGSVPVTIQSSPDGTSWSPAFSVTNMNSARALKGFGGYLFIGGHTTDPFGQIIRWDGTTQTQDVIMTAITNRFVAFEVFNGKLHAALFDTVTPRLFVRDNSSGNWTVATTLAAGAIADSPYAMVEFRGLLIIGSQAGTVRTWDGTTLSSAISLGGGSGTVNLAKYNNRLFAGISVGTGTGCFVSDDGTTWSRTYESFSNQNIQAMQQSGNALYVSVSTGEIFVFSEDDTIYKVANYQGTPFTSPPQKRHRFFFNVDRQGYINNVDDAMLIGIGFVPRYLGLRGNG